MKLVVLLVVFASIVFSEAYRKKHTNRERRRGCPAGVKRVRCSVNLCDYNKKCEAYPLARCKMTKCGECKAQFYVNRRKVDCDLPAVSKCTKGLRRCFRNPCRPSTTCEAHPEAKCVPNYCGGCKAEFFLGNEKVDCTKKSGVSECNTVKCFNPCRPSLTCEAHPKAKCVPNYCGECKAEFFLGNEKVDCTKKSDECQGKKFQCFINPCRFATCEAHPRAECVPNYCGGCNAEFFLGKEKVDCTKKSVSDKCQGKIFRCSVNPCMFATCKAHANAKCVPNYCGGCNAEFFLGDEKVDCTEKSE